MSKLVAFEVQAASLVTLAGALLYVLAPWGS